MAIETFDKEVDESRRFQFDFSEVDEIKSGADTIASVTAVTRSPDSTKAEFGSVLTYDALEATFADETVNANDPEAADVDLIGLLDDVWYQGGVESKYAGFRWVLSVAGVAGVLTWEYSKGMAEWGSLAVAAVEGTVNFTGTANALTFTPPADWVKDTVNGVKAFWVRARVTTLYTTAPVGTVGRLTGLADLTIGSMGLANALAQVMISGGLAGKLYGVKCKVTTTAGAILVRKGDLRVLDRQRE